MSAAMDRSSLTPRRRRRGFPLALALLAVAIALSACQSNRSLPDGISYAGTPRPATEVRFLRDESWVDENGERHVDQQIFDAVFAIIAGAERLIVVDMFLYNDSQGPVPETTRALSSELTEALLARKGERPALEVVVITDPVNTLYGGLVAEHLERLSAAGVTVVTTDLTELPDSNPAWSIIWRPFIQPFGNSPGGLLPNPIGDGKVSFRSYFALFNFKANHRKTILADRGDGFVAIVSSANPHDGSSAHRNAAIEFNGPAVADLLTTENAVLAFSGAPTVAPLEPVSRERGAVTVEVLTEGRIARALLDAIDGAAPGDEVRLMMFYLSDRRVVEALERAQARGVTVRLILDPNKDAFGREKSGIPNRPVARELTDAGVPVRWCNTQGEQCHAKMILIDRASGESVLISGSANFTRRNLGDYNLETDVAVHGPATSRVLADAREYFDSAWRND
ncbi:MAG: phospholipase D-like domain-containing protein, partial [Pseudomonadota bacterium]